jgi:hypothetical protein
MYLPILLKLEVIKKDGKIISNNKTLHYLCMATINETTTHITFTTFLEIVS